MQTLPAEAMTKLSLAQRAELEVWWGGLDDRARADFTAMYDERAEDTAFYATESDGRIEWHELPIELHGHFIDPEEQREHAMWKQELCDYIQAHEELRFFLVERSFHICRAHAVARRVAATGVVPADFSCPFARGDCPFIRALAVRPGHAIALVPRRVGR